MEQQNLVRSWRRRNHLAFSGLGSQSYFGAAKDIVSQSSFLGARPRLCSCIVRPERPEPRTNIRQSPQASSLEDSKRRARSKYDNIPDLNEQYIAELGWIERKYGPDRLGGKNLLREAQNSIIVKDNGSIKRGAGSDGKDPQNELQVKPDLSEYQTVRNRLLGDTLFVGALGICTTWTVGDLRDVTSFALGVVVAIAYVSLLARSVERMADAARETGRAMGDPLQAARVGLFVVTVIGAARNANRFSVLAVILGFLTYKIASLLPLLTGEAFE